MKYQINFDGALSPELAHLLRSIESHLNAQVLHTQGQMTGTTGSTGSTGSGSTGGSTGSTGSTGTTNPPCLPGQNCSDSVKTGHDVVIAVVVTAVVAGTIGYVVGKNSASVKTGHDTATPASRSPGSPTR